MRLDKVIELISYTTVQDSLGQDIQTENTRQTFAAERGSPRSEIFSAGQKGLRSAAMFVVYADEYLGETDLNYAGKKYSVYRVYPRGDRMTELYCEVRTGG